MTAVLPKGTSGWPKRTQGCLDLHTTPARGTQLVPPPPLTEFGSPPRNWGVREGGVSHQGPPPQTGHTPPKSHPSWSSPGGPIILLPRRLLGCPPSTLLPIDKPRSLAFPPVFPNVPGLI